MASQDAGSATTGPLVRVEDAALAPEGGPVRVVVSRMDRLTDVADAVASAGGIVEGGVEDRLRVTVMASRLVDAAGRTGGAELAEPLEQVLDAAIEAWAAPAPDVATSAGDLPCSERPVVMGVLNVTPDSFSDGGVHYDPDDPGAAIEHGQALLEAGADIIDVGGESTRPGADPVGEDEERDRVMPVVEALAGAGACVSIDTSKSTIARGAVEAGAAIVNDVSAGTEDGLMLQTVVELDVPYVVMHMLGTPRTMQRDPRYEDVVAEVFEFLAEQTARVTEMGLGRDKVIIDPGIGFGKTAQHNLELLRRVRELRSLGRPVLVGASRKSFLGDITGVEKAAERASGSVGAAASAVTHGAAIVRAHDVAETVEAVRVAHAIATAPMHNGSQTD